MGAADPTGTLQEGEVLVVQAGHLVAAPRVLVYKSPGTHPGDVRIMRAVGECPPLHDILQVRL
eukprot:396553-Prorocentrum_minimum.AAC.1